MAPNNGRIGPPTAYQLHAVLGRGSCALAAIVVFSACTHKAVVPRSPENDVVWRQYYPLAHAELERNRSKCAEHNLDLEAYIAGEIPECEASEKWTRDIRQAFLESHPGLDPTLAEYIRDGTVAPALSVDTVRKEVDSEVHVQDQARREKTVRPDQQAQFRRQLEEADARWAKRNPFCRRLLKEIVGLKPCMSMDSEYHMEWPGHHPNESVDMRVCVLGGYEPFDLRMIDSRTGATTLLSFQALTGTAFVARPPKTGECWVDVKVLFTPGAAKRLGNIYEPNYGRASIRVHGTYKGLWRNPYENKRYPLIRATQAEREKSPRPLKAR